MPNLSPEEDLLFEALARGTTSPSELASALDLPVRHILLLLASPAITTHLDALEAATDHLARHTTRLRHNLAFKSLEQALTAAAAKDNPAEIRRIATLLLKPTPPLPDPEAEQAERAERITKHRRAVKDDAKSEQEDAEFNALATAMVMGRSPSLPRALPAREGRGEGVKTQSAQPTPRAATPTPSPVASATPKPSAMPAVPAASTSHPPTPHSQLNSSCSPSSPQATQHHPAQPRAA